MTLNIFRTPHPIPYKEALQRQKILHERRVSGDIPDTLWMLEHPPVITTGLRKGQSYNILVNPADVGAELIQTERGGEVTYHGPGQLVGYMFVGIDGFAYRVKDFVCRIEGAFIDYLHKYHGIEAHHEDEHTGVWVGMDKITAIGIAIRKRVTFHGFAFNINTVLSHYQWIVPCGISDSRRGVTSLQELLGQPVNLGEAAENIGHSLRSSLGYDSGDYRVE